MPKPIPVRVWTLTIAAALPAVLGGCGGSTKTVSVANSPTAARTTGTTTTQPTTSTAATTPSGADTNSASSGGGTPAPTTTRTAKAPAFTEKEKGATAEGGLPAAVATVHAHGYTATDTSDYHPDQTLRVLVGTRTGSSDGYDQQAFFFIDGRYLGTDASSPSAQVKVIAQHDTEVTLAYSLYRSSDPLCCPGGGQARVRFQLNNGHLTPQSPLPPASSTTGSSRQ